MLATRASRFTGFTLVELLVVIAIFALALAIGMPSMNEWIQNAQIRTAAENIRSGLQAARTEAIRRNANIRFEISGTGAGWTITAVNDGSDVQKMPDDEGTRNVTVSVLPAGATQVVFNGLGRSVTALYGAAITPMTQIDLDSASLGASESRELRLIILEGGEVKMCDPNVSDTEDPRRCPST